MKVMRDNTPASGRWIFFTAFRYFRTKRKSRGFTTSILSILGISVGVIAIISVIGVMNGFQLGFIEDILEIRSYHLRLTFTEDFAEIENAVEKIKQIDNVKAVLPFLDIQVLAEGYFEDFEVASLRGVPPNVERLDPDLIKQLSLIRGSMDLQRHGSIILGSEIARSLSVGIADTVTIHALSGDSFSDLQPKSEDFVITGIFKSGYYEFDKSTGFIRMDDAFTLQGHKRGKVIGVKLYNYFQDRKTLSQISQVLLPDSYSPVSWREFNRSFFSALKLEKLVMILLLSLIFIVVGVNIYHALQRTVYEKREEIGILRSIGAPGSSVRWIFILEGIFIGAIGGFIGLLTGLVIAGNIDFLMSSVETVVNGVQRLLQAALEAVAGDGDFAIFSSSYYYLTEIPAKVLPLEAVLVFFFALATSTLAAFLASKAVVEVNPCEVLRYE